MLKVYNLLCWTEAVKSREKTLLTWLKLIPRPLWGQRILAAAQGAQCVLTAATDFILVTTTATSVSLMGVQSSDLILNFSSFSLGRALNPNRNSEGKESAASLGLDALLGLDMSVLGYNLIKGNLQLHFMWVYVPWLLLLLVEGNTSNPPNSDPESKPGKFYLLESFSCFHKPHLGLQEELLTPADISADAVCNRSHILDLISRTAPSSPVNVVEIWWKWPSFALFCRGSN